jgi:hypothetical protein
MKLYHQLGINMKYLQLFTKIINKTINGKPIGRTRFEFQTTETNLRGNLPRRTDTTPQRTQESKETTTTEPQERKTITLDCFCGSWTHPCEVEIHEKYDFHCDCIVETEFNPEKHLIITTIHDGEHDAN